MKEAQNVLVFPLGGLDQSRAYRSQKVYGNGVFTTADALNARGHEWSTDRARGGSRPGLSKYYLNKTHDLAYLDPYSIQDINQMFLGFIPPTGLFSYWTRARADGEGSAIGTRTGGTQVVYNDTDPLSFAGSCWDHPEAVAYIAEIDDDETPDTAVYRLSPTGSTYDWFEFMPETAEKITGMVVVGDHLYVGWFNSLSTPTSRVYKYDKRSGVLVDDPNPWISTTGYAGLVFTTQSTNVLARIGRLIGIQTTSSTGRFSIFDTESSTPNTPVFTTASQGTYNTARACKVDSDEVEFFYTSVPITGGLVQKIKADGTVIWSYTPVSDDNYISYDRPANRVCVLSRDTGLLRTVNCDTGLLKDTVSSTSLGSSTSWRDLCTDWNGNLVLYANSVASGDVMCVDAAFNDVWGPNTFANTTHDGAAALRGQLVGIRHRALVVSGGRVHRFDRDGSTPVTTNPNSLDPNVPYVLSAQNGTYMYYADGGGYRRYNPDTDAMEDWTASAGTMPVDSAGRSGRLICTYNGRTALSGFLAEPQNIFFSAKDNPRDWDYAPAFTVPTQAVALNASYAGLIGDKVTGLCPHSDDVLIIFCDGSIWQLTGDPMYGGQIDNLVRGVGAAYGKAWCLDPDKTVYFFGSRGGVFTIVPGGKPQRISDAIADRLYSVNVSEDETVIRLVWDDRAQGLHLFVTPLDRRQPATHYFWDKRNNAWWPVEFAHTNFNPKCCHAFDGDDADDRIVLIGSWDSHVRAVDTETVKDDGRAFESYVAIGPILDPSGGEVMISELQGLLGNDSGAVTYEIVAANDPQAALESVTKVNLGKWKGSKRTAAWSGGRNPTHGVRVAGHAIYVYVRGSDRWALEGVRAALSHLGWVRGRSF